MKLATYTRQDLWIALAVLPIYHLLLGYFLFGSRYFTDLSTFLSVTLINVVIGLISYQFLHTRIALWFRNRLPHYRQTQKRMVQMLVAHILINSAAVTILFQAYRLVHFPGYTYRAETYYWALLTGVILNTLLTCLHEGVYAFEQWELKLQETEKLKKANLQSQFESLKQQVNPHFLFNSLNSLSSLIDEDPGQAELFLEELSSVYRYLLRSNESELVTLAEELRFANSYFHLLRTRYGDDIRLRQRIDSRYDSYLLPPLTLQLLLENVVKHNAMLPELPLTIQLETTDGGQLIVRNNIQRKTIRAVSNQVGLANIATKYRLLGKGDVRVEDDGRYFTVLLPLLETNHLTKGFV